MTQTSECPVNSNKFSVINTRPFLETFACLNKSMSFYEMFRNTVASSREQLLLLCGDLLSTAGIKTATEYHRLNIINDRDPGTSSRSTENSAVTWT